MRSKLAAVALAGALVCAASLTTPTPAAAAPGDTAAEVVDARVWGGIHWRTADRVGRALGQRIGRHALRHALRQFHR